VNARVPTAIAAVTVSDRTSQQVLGVPWRSLRPWCIERGIAITRIGRRPVVRVADVLAALEGAEQSTWSEDEVIARAARGGRR
jgi:hypothetical protein